MLVLNPTRVVFDGGVWTRVTAVTVDRSARSPLVAYGGGGPHAVLVDAVERRVIVRVVQTMLGDDFDGPELGAAGVLEFTAGAGSGSGSFGGSLGGHREVRVDRAVVTEVTYALLSGPLTGRSSDASAGTAAAAARGATRTVVLLGVSSDGATDPVSVAGVV